jgi:type I restriction enzyme, S subunit
VDTALEHAGAAIKRAEALRRNLLADLLSRGIGEDGKVRDRTCTGGRPWAFLQSIGNSATVGKEFDVQNGFTLNQERRAHFRMRRYLRVANVQRDALDLADVQELGADDAEFTPRRLELDDLLVVEGHADRMQIGRCARVTAAAVGMTFQNHLF